MFKNNFTLYRIQFTGWVFALCQYRVRDLNSLVFFTWIAESLISKAIEYVITGEMFYHYFDVIFTLVLAVVYFYLISTLGDYLLSDLKDKGHVYAEEND